MARRRHSLRHRLHCEEFESRYCLAAPAFVDHTIDCCSISGANVVLPVDIDGDSDFDIVSGSQDLVAWYENEDGQGTLGSPRVAATREGVVVSIDASDVDGDGDIDLIASNSRKPGNQYVAGDQVAWFENLDGKGTFGPRHSVGPAVLADSVRLADMDGDGDADALSASYIRDLLVWHENTDGKGTFGAPHIIREGFLSWGPHSVHAVDLDGDGDLDVLSSAYSARGNQSGSTEWFENTDGKGTFGPRRIIASGVRATPADVDGDGDLDVVRPTRRWMGGLGNTSLDWFENTDGKGNFGGARLIVVVKEDSVGPALSVDVDGDQDVDLVARHGRTMALFENLDGKGQFSEPRFFDFKPNEFVVSYNAADLDGDGDQDLMAAWRYEDRITWYHNLDGKGMFGDAIAVTRSANAVFAADLDGDDDPDLITASRTGDSIVWYPNTDGKGGFGDRRMITRATLNAHSVFGADLDGDGDIDVLSASGTYDEGKVAWYENMDGQGTFGEQRLIEMARDARSVFASDIDKDGDIDVLAATLNAIAWYENTDGKGSFSAAKTIESRVFRGRSVSTADMDGDGDLDVVMAAERIPFIAGALAWYENTDGKGRFGAVRLVAATGSEYLQSAHPSDLDGDGDLDVLFLIASRFFGYQIGWYENRDGKGSFGALRNIDTRQENNLPFGGTSVSAADMDSDGDLDVLAPFAWYENIDGKGKFANRRIVLPGTAEVAYPSDLDADGDIDVVTGSMVGSIAWYEQRVAGDSNGDGIFTSSDLVRVFQAGKYEDGIPGNASFDEGDWNGDREFDSSDLTFAFQYGHYEAPQPTLAANVHAAIDWLFANDGRTRKSKAFLA